MHAYIRMYIHTDVRWQKYIHIHMHTWYAHTYQLQIAEIYTCAHTYMVAGRSQRGVGGGSLVSNRARCVELGHRACITRMSRHVHATIRANVPVLS